MAPRPYDYVIIGAGIAGLNAAYQIRKREPNARYVILEAGAAAGGRAVTTLFGGTEVVTGAGVGRKAKDHHLQALLHELRVPFYEFEAAHAYGPGVEPPDPAALKALEAALTPADHAITFLEYARRVLGREGAKKFIDGMGYTDMLAADAYHTVKHYGLDDNVPGSHRHQVWLSIPWGQLIKALVKAVGPRRILYGAYVERLQELAAAAAAETAVSTATATAATADTPRWEVTTTARGTFRARKVICATTISTLRKLFPRVREYRYIESQPFLRVYAKFPRALRAYMQKVVPTYTVVLPPLQKIIPMDPSKGVYMIAYSDNKAAQSVRHALVEPNSPASRAYFARLVERALGLPERALEIDAIQAHYWEEGTHYFKPCASHGNEEFRRNMFLEKASCPAGYGRGIVIVGEALTPYQGWVEGALRDQGQAILAYQ